MSLPYRLTTPQLHSAFYKFTPLARPDEVGVLLREMVSRRGFDGLNRRRLFARFELLERRFVVVRSNPCAQIVGIGNNFIS